MNYTGNCRDQLGQAPAKIHLEAKSVHFYQADKLTTDFNHYFTATPIALAIERGDLSSCGDAVSAHQKGYCCCFFFFCCPSC